ncbi:Diphthine methyltransferase [Babesia sp. Xinjiang]|uniref:Diphthine methyltransferase n=1 Tax=Babesia sp. Xinjiang TaxID=462227 RepID=UPI000A222E0B|nr:Diphthine methyltransferase [Babesia sp. Xinjiang]ORM40896.1 Diphthine methyltransferase [Babesia sp. Xinjiang]
MELDQNGVLIHKIDTNGQPDCLKVFPHDLFEDDTLKGTFLAATYNYDSASRKRSGSIIAFKPCRALETLLKRDNEHDNNALNFSIAQHDLPGVLSCSWIRTQDHYAAACVTANLSINTLQLATDTDENLSFKAIDEISLDPQSDAVGLSLSCHDDGLSLCSVTASDGNVYIVEDGIVTQKWKAHDVETWISVFQPDNTNILMTGADDSSIKVFDRREGTAPVRRLNHNSSGVTALQFNKRNTNLLYTGSFDRQLMRFDMRNMNMPISTSQLDGAVWFMDFLDEDTVHIAGCYDGAFAYTSDEQGEKSQ